MRTLIEDYIEESKTQERVIKSSVIRELKHMLKCKYQFDYPDKESWRNSILGAYAEIRAEFKSKSGEFNGSLYKNYYRKKLDIIPLYSTAVTQAAKETRIPERKFPSECEWTRDQLIDPDFISQFIDEYGYGWDETKY